METILSMLPEELALTISEGIAYAQNFGIEALAEKCLGLDLAPLAGFSTLLAVIGFGLSFLVYLLNSIAMVRMSAKTHTRGGWMAFFPLLEMWQLGRVADAGADRKKHAKRIMGTFFWSILLAIIGTVGMAILPSVILSGEKPVTLVVTVAAVAAFVAMVIVLIMHQIYKWIAECSICVNFGNAGWFVAIFLTGWFGLSLIPAILRQALAGHTPKYRN